MKTIVFLVASNVFMTAAWYGHLRYKDVPLVKVILASWGVAFFEYCLQVPANRWGHQTFSTYELKILQEAITLVVFVAFAFVWLNEVPRWNHVVAGILLFGAVTFAFLGHGRSTAREGPLHGPREPSHD
jgi:uncharacterized protein (DUF486 family)